MVAYEASQSLELQSELSQDQCYSNLESPGLLMELDEGPSHHNPTEDEYEKLEASRQRLALLYQLDQLMVYPHNYGQDPGEDGVSEAESDHDLESEWEGISPELELGGEQDVSVQVDGDESPQHNNEYVGERDPSKPYTEQKARAAPDIASFRIECGGLAWNFYMVKSPQL
ncbi:hypothetical protein BGZ58_010029 [Dissophora ornata]|nr:hypothetical protein BGZ58_010029 [Dissophora ornata]